MGNCIFFAQENGAPAKCWIVTNTLASSNLNLWVSGNACQPCITAMNYATYLPTKIRSWHGPVVLASGARVQASGYM